MENQERELLKTCADFLQRKDASEIISFIVNHNVSYEDIKNAYNKVYIDPESPFRYVELNRDCLYFEYEDQQNKHYEFDLDFDVFNDHDHIGSGEVKIRK